MLRSHLCIYNSKLLEEYIKKNSGWVKIERKRKDVAVYQKDNIYEIELKKCNKNSENNKAETEEDQLNLIDPKKLIEYIENIGWIPFGIRRKNDTTLLYKRKNQPITKMDSLVTIPIDKDLWNYKQLLKVAVLQIARTENCTMMEVVKSIINFRERGGNYGEIKQVRIL